MDVDALEDEAEEALVELEELAVLELLEALEALEELEELDELPHPARPHMAMASVQISAVTTIFGRFMECSLVRR